jgi:hypothetical protein
MRVYYFSNTVHTISNLALKRLKVSRFSQLNDPFELLAADLLNPHHKNALEILKANLDQSKGMLCFSTTWSNPLLWGHYANKHSGIALGFDIPDTLLSSVYYTRNRAQKIEIDPKNSHVVNGLVLLNRLIRTKFLDWQYEAEYRMFVDLDETTQEAGNYFIDFSTDLQLSEVVLGLKCELPKARIKQLLGDNFEKVKVVKAGMARREFKIIEDRSARVT